MTEKEIITIPHHLGNSIRYLRKKFIEIVETKVDKTTQSIHDLVDEVVDLAIKGLEAGLNREQIRELIDKKVSKRQGNIDRQ